MSSQRRRLVWYVTGLAGVVLGYTLLYDYGMSAWEGRPVDLLHAFVIVIETFTTTGYGEDAPWISSQMEVLVVFMQLTGVFVIFLTLPLFVAPWVERRFAPSVPAEVSMADHVVICGFSSRGESLIEDLESWEQPYVVVEADREQAESLRERGLAVIHGDPESVGTLERASAASATALIADATDEVNASIVLSAREVADDLRLIAFAEEPEMVDYLEYAGADEVFSPRQLLGETLARRVTTAVTTELGGAVEIGDDFNLVELPVQPDSELAGVTLAESGIRERTGAHVIGLWHRGAFEPRPTPERVLDADTHLFVSGSESQLEAVKRLTLSEELRRARGTVVVAGFGEVGSTVGAGIARSTMKHVVIDARDRPGVDVVGDATEAETLREAGLEAADSLVLALSSDRDTILATLVARELNPTLQIVARAEDADSVGKIYRAGADYVLALGTVSGRMIASTILDEEVVSPERQLEIVRTEAPGLVGQSLRGADVRARTGCTVVAVERGGEVVTDLDPSETVRAGDVLIVVGTDEAMHAFAGLAH